MLNLPPEIAHNLALKALSTNTVQKWLPALSPQDCEGLEVLDSPFGRLAHPIGLAAGVDKNGVAINGLTALGFSFVEVGTVTPKAQVGNTKPRLFRLKDQRALVNAMGFNNDGAQSLVNRLRSPVNRARQIKLGINIGKNKITDNSNAVQDYEYCYNTFIDYCDYIVINISSPNTTNLRELANVDFIQQLSTLISKNHIHRILFKLDPDQSKKQFQSLIESLAEYGFGGVILTNTLKVNQPIMGGLSGHPLLSRSNQFLEWAFEVHKGTLPMVASGGILSGIDVFEKISRGACLVQLYSALIYRGPSVVLEVLRELREYMQSKGIKNLSEVRNLYYQESIY